jgi:citrate lyase subunit beta/citryl-CoA lyase
MLFLPAHVDKFVARAHTRGADAYVLDLEDSVPLGCKHVARMKVIAGADLVSQAGPAALVRINSEPELAALDIVAVVSSKVSAIVLPKVVNGEAVRSVAARLDELEHSRSIPNGHTRLIAQIEDVHALAHLDEIAASSTRLLGLSLGSEDFAASAGMEPVPEALIGPNQQVVFACARASVLPFGFPASIADYADPEALRIHVSLARKLGFVGAFCIHPLQIGVLNEEFSPSQAEVQHARELIAAYESARAQGRSAVEHRGKMVDPPIVRRAQLLMSRAGFAARPGSELE